ncbi:beta-lactamase [Hirsutella rhossiliensis]|uniref:Beta-lactamase domain-containing protein n=1 Tax=Hirsutella rhossiliensis TaxID=111463 RepID=A0A9P8MZ51_9HYPO|nr:beta-lactamase domain-containing protein [Hirsutella rhossiliensis]KAH0962936.1 beta-lactamase domain-containing protein [Hirsutella rhossiliensis]
MVKARRVLSAAAVLQPVVNGAIAGHEQKPLGSAQPGDKGLKRENPYTADYDALASKILDQWHVPGMSIAVVDGDDIFAKAFGFATLPDTPATPETLYYVGSTTMAHTAAVLAQLIDAKAYPEPSRGWTTPISSILRDDFVLHDE